MFLLHNHVLYSGFKRHKVIIELKHIRFKSFAETTISKKSIDGSKRRIQLMSEILDCSVSTAIGITSKNRNILAINHDVFNRNVNFCKKYFRLSEIIELPLILSLNSSLLQHRYFSLIELGALNINAWYIFRYLHILKKSPKMLKKEGILFSFEYNSSTLDEFLDSSERAEINSKLQNMYADGSSLSQIRETMNAEFFAAKLGCSIGRAHQIFHIYPPLRVQSICNTNKLLNTLHQKLEFSNSKINSCVTLLSLHHETVEHFISEMPEILGTKIELIIKRVPAALRRPVELIKEIETILKYFDISDAQLICCPKTIIFSPKTLKDRLTFLCNSEDFAMLKSYKKFLWLVYNFNNLHPRLEALKTRDIPSSISMFIVSKSTFNKYLRFSQCRTRIHDICFYLANLFALKENDVLAKLHEYPNYQHSSLSNCQKVVEYLLQAGVSKKQIFNGIGIIFYDFDVVVDYFKDLENHPECQPFYEWVTHYNLIQLLIYVIEIDSGFQGSRLYKTESNIDEEESVSSF